MSNIFWKNFHLCFSSKLRYPQSLIQPQPSPPSKQDHNPSSSTSRLLLKNFNSIYHPHNPHNHEFSSSEFSTSKSITTDDHYFSSSSDSESDVAALSPPDFATIFASQRFFFSSPGRSNSIFESPDSTKVDYSNRKRTLDGAGVPVKKYSPDPYMDFRSSMEEMVEARNLKDVRNDWDYLHELLLCYLTLNPKHTHKFIISAFADILVSLLSSPDSGDSNDRKHECHRRKSNICDINCGNRGHINGVK